MSKKLKIENRREHVYELHLKGLRKSEIAAELKVSERTVRRDLKAVATSLEPVDYGKVRREVLDSLRVIKREIREGLPSASPALRGRLLKLLAAIEWKIAERVIPEHIQQSGVTEYILTWQDDKPDEKPIYVLENELRLRKEREEAERQIKRKKRMLRSDPYYDRI